MPWRAVKDPGSGRTYFQNTASGKTSWTSPAPAGWVVKADPSSGQMFFNNKTTGESKWKWEDEEAPKGKRAPPAKQGKRAPAAAKAGAGGKKGKIEKEDIGGNWWACTDGKSKWYVHKVTRRRTWHKPENAKRWIEMKDDKTGKTYYLDTVTKKTRWDNPEESEHDGHAVLKAGLGGERKGPEGNADDVTLVDALIGTPKLQAAKEAAGHEATYQERMNAGEELQALRGWFYKMNKRGKEQRRYVQLFGTDLTYYDTVRHCLEGHSAKEKVDMRMAQQICAPSADTVKWPKKAPDGIPDEHAENWQDSPYGTFDIVFQARTMHFRPDPAELEKNKPLADTLKSWKTRVVTGWMGKANYWGNVVERWYLLCGAQLFWFKGPTDRSYKKKPLDLNNMVKCVEAKDPKARALGGIDLVYPKDQKDYTLIPRAGDTGSKELRECLLNWWTKDKMQELATTVNSELQFFECKLTREPELGFGMVITNCPPLPESPEGWQGHDGEHVRVTVIKDKGPADRKKIVLQDALVEVNGIPVSTVMEVSAASKGADSAIFKFCRFLVGPPVPTDEELRVKRMEQIKSKKGYRDSLERIKREKKQKELDTLNNTRRRRGRKKKRDKHAFGQIKAEGVDDVDYDDVEMEGGFGQSDML